MNKKVTIIVPVYNAKRYLNKCIRSLLQQIFRNIEIILVDDGSTDGSNAVCRRFAKGNPNVSVYCHNNSGVSTVRNLGIEKAKGEYLMFVDADDWLPRDAVEQLVRSLEKDDSDLCIGNFCNISSIRSYCEKHGAERTIERNNAAAFVESSITADGKCWGKLYKTSLIKDNQLAFDEEVRWGEDALFLVDYLFVCNKIHYFDGIVYKYNLLDADSMTKTYQSAYNRWFFQCFQRYLNLLNSLPAFQNSSEAKLRLLKFYFETSCMHYVRNTGREEAMTEIIETCTLYQRYLIAYVDQSRRGKFDSDILRLARDE